MNNFIIYGSPNKNSFTMELLRQSERQSLENACFFNCFEARPTPCDGCGFCKASDGCKFDDLNDFFKDFERAENVILAFPVYNGSFPAPLKSLIDRFQWLYNARFFKNKRPPIGGKRDVTLVITAGSKKNPLPLITSQLKPLFTISGCKLKKAVMLLNTDNNPTLKTVEF